MRLLSQSFTKTFNGDCIFNCSLKDNLFIVLILKDLFSLNKSNSIPIMITIFSKVKYINFLY